MGFLTDLWNAISEFFQIEAVEPIVPETKEPPKPHEPAESVTTLPEKPVAEAPVEEIEPLPSETISEPTPIGEQGRADRIKVLPAKEEPEPSVTTKTMMEAPESQKIAYDECINQNVRPIEAQRNELLTPYRYYVRHDDPRQHELKRQLDALEEQYDTETRKCKELAFGGS